MTEPIIKPSNYRRCSRCNKNFSSRAGCDQHIQMKHKGIGEKLPVLKKEYEPSMGDLMVEAEINRAMGIKNEDWIEDMLI